VRTNEAWGSAPSAKKKKGSIMKKMLWYISPFLPSLILLNILMWGSWIIYDVSGTCFSQTVQDPNCKIASWGWTVLFSIQFPLLIFVFLLAVIGVEEFRKRIEED